MIGLKPLLWTAAGCLGIAALLLACVPAQPASTPPVDGTPSSATDLPEPATSTPAAPDDSPLPTPDRATRLAPEATGLPELVPQPTARPPVIGEVPVAILDPIIADLAGRLGVAADQIQVVRGESVTWSDGSLGCPEPGMMYTQALVDGYWVVLEHGGQSYDYRVMQGGSFRLCENPAAEPPGLPADSSNR